MPNNRYHINEEECLAIIWAVKRYKHFLEDRRFKLRTVSKALMWLNQAKESTAKLTKWSLILQEFRFDIQHCAGESNGLADLLSRHPQKKSASEEELEVVDRITPPEIIAAVLPKDPGGRSERCSPYRFQAGRVSKGSSPLRATVCLSKGSPGIPWQRRS